jgi:single-strand DNA-binding protein
MPNANLVILMGHLIRDPDLRYTPSGMAVATFGIAVNNRVKKGTEWENKPVFVDVTVWANTAELCSNNLSKGKPVYLEGRLDFQQWEDKSSGQKRSKVCVIGEKVQFLSAKQGGSPLGQDENGEELPF